MKQNKKFNKKFFNLIKFHYYKKTSKIEEKVKNHEMNSILSLKKKLFFLFNFFFTKKKPLSIKTGLFKLARTSLD